MIDEALKTLRALLRPFLREVGTGAARLLILVLSQVKSAFFKSQLYSVIDVYCHLLP